jgi:EAL domain-containing protein (putative c-di-GMP-specific phosphodiesterase class I)
VIANGIETSTELSFVRQLGIVDVPLRGSVQGAQGFLLGRPSETIDGVTLAPEALLA